MRRSELPLKRRVGGGFGASVHSGVPMRVMALTPSIGTHEERTVSF